MCSSSFMKCSQYSQPWSSCDWFGLSLDRSVPNAMVLVLFLNTDYFWGRFQSMNLTARIEACHDGSCTVASGSFFRKRLEVTLTVGLGLLPTIKEKILPAIKKRYFQPNGEKNCTVAFILLPQSKMIFFFFFKMCTYIK